MRGRLLLTTTILTISLVGSAQAFQRNVSLCNRSTETLEVAYAYDAAGTSEITSRGWRKIAPCSCRDLFSADVRASEFFYYITRSGTFDTLSGGNAPICIDPSNAFRYLNQNRSQSSCQQSGGRWVNFAFSNATSTDFKLNFRMSGGPGCNM
jgi:hypothetical protein